MIRVALWVVGIGMLVAGGGCLVMVAVTWWRSERAASKSLELLREATINGFELLSDLLRAFGEDNERLRAENELLVRELWWEWWIAHVELCGTTWPHKGDRCWHPLPSALADTSAPRGRSSEGRTPPARPARPDWPLPFGDA